MAHSSHVIDNQVDSRISKHSTSQLLQRNPHLRESNTMSPYDQLITRHLVTPGSVTSASSFEESVVSDQTSEFGTPALLQSNSKSWNSKQEIGVKQPRKKLSSLNRELLVRNLEVESTAFDRNEDTSENLLEHLVIKTVPSLNDSSRTRTITTLPLSPQSSKVTRRIVVSPRRTLRRVVVRKVGVNGETDEKVEYLDGDGHVVEEMKKVSDELNVRTIEQSQDRIVENENEIQKFEMNGNNVRTNQDVGTVVTQSIVSNNQVRNESSSQRKVTRRVVRRKVVREDGTKISYSDSDLDESFANSTISESSVQELNVSMNRHQVIPSKDLDVNLEEMKHSVNTEDDTNQDEERKVTRRVVTPSRIVRRIIVRKEMIETKGTDEEKNEMKLIPNNVVDSKDFASLSSENHDWNCSEHECCTKSTNDFQALEKLMSECVHENIEESSNIDKVMSLSDLEDEKSISTIEELDQVPRIETMTLEHSEQLMSDSEKIPCDDLEIEKKSDCTNSSDHLQFHSNVSDHENREYSTASSNEMKAKNLQSDLEMWLQDRIVTITPCSLLWSDICYKRNENDWILNHVSGSIEAGEFLVLSSPMKDQSLALLSCLSGFEDKMEGNVRVNGEKWNEMTKRYVAYVREEDFFYQTLTVYEHLIFQAKLRMRRTHLNDMCVQRVECIVQEFDLTKCQNTLICDIPVNEHKLLALATACLTNPSFLFVEEPIENLEFWKAEQIVKKLQWLATGRGMTVICTMQMIPSFVYDHVDILYIVADGACVYDGKACNAIGYFSTIGYPCPEEMNPFEYFMLQLNNDGDHNALTRVNTLKREWSERNAAIYADNAVCATRNDENRFQDYNISNRYYHMNCCGQLYLLWTRHICRLRRYYFVFSRDIFIMLFLGTIFGFIYFQLDVDDQHGVQNFSSAFYSILIVQMLVITYRTFVYAPKEIAIALRERQEYRGGWYHLLCWYSTKLMAEFPALILLSIALFVPVYLLIGISQGFNVYVYMQLVVILVGWSTIGLAFLTLSVLQQVTISLIVHTIILVFFAVFGNYFIHVTAIPDWLVWLHYISPLKFAYDALMKIFWKRVDTITCDWTLDGCVARTGEQLLTFYKMDTRSALSDTLILFAICCTFFLVALVFLIKVASNRHYKFHWQYQWYDYIPLTFQSGTTQQSLDQTIRSKTPSIVEDRITVIESDKYYIQVQTPRESGRTDISRVTLSWYNLQLITKDKKCQVENVLNQSSGSVMSGEMLLITGPSIVSNEALLATLAGYLDTTSGRMTINGVATSARELLEYTAFVPRNESFYDTLTVEEHLRYQAQLYFGMSSYSCSSNHRDVEIERVVLLLDEFDLTMKRHMILRHLSLVDRKLLAIASAIIRHPSILLIEEPTHGMDIYSSERVILKLRQLARIGHTVLVTIARPSSHLYPLFDSLHLLAEGSTVYHGKVTEAVPYFASLGYQCPQYKNPAEYFVRLLSVCDSNTETNENQITRFKEFWTTQISENHVTINPELPEVLNEEMTWKQRRAGFCSQWILLLCRHFLHLIRSHCVLLWHALYMSLFGLFFGLIFLQLDVDDQRDIQNWSGALFCIIVLHISLSMSRTFVLIPHERAIVKQEYRIFGRYYLSCWYFSKVLVEILVMFVLSVCVFVPAYLLIGFGHGFELYIYMQIVMWLAGLSATGLVYLLLGLFEHVHLAALASIVLLVLFVLFGGFLINVDDIPDYFNWMYYTSPVKYGYEALMKLFWERIPIVPCNSSTVSNLGSSQVDDCIAQSGDEVLAYYSMDISRSARSDSFILVGLAALYFTLSYLVFVLCWRWVRTQQRQK
ncbi:Pleiotropic drug resistance proteins (PDR1-15), ABC superfamily [Plasmopara halstedii]|uniref:Pleiotropic drug resistance proteins (PDR1-15), ABC superfamily n=1 Tax=Plasmopara halstedii TaxID=4781 RepID=A0A0P1AVF7_PLAHL|nr:Pleiotropic drug resistance proteins (PDR1-15), ABC superfamily [Plasmopara halstedii]CEG44559.1 Pleiotropic drug resistance proteins (PDR1-15), ABC superfamily [Plasmopara halstedii]|eukprot:XP_024580928.1 Pleiotropic drug resistance proteins (PDR1-15), ABC superfamily [Plasmopara halstedii]